jgi:hypothetical protein
MMFVLWMMTAGCGAPEGRAGGDCTDASDNDGDGAFDCADDGCAGSPACVETDTDVDTDADSDSDSDTDADTDVVDSDTSGLPVAVCNATLTTVAPPFQSLTVSGGESYDPLSHALTAFDWGLLAAPPGSVAPLAGTGSSRTFTPDAAGAYDLALSVQTDDGRASVPCSVLVSAVPEQDLFVELYWEHAADDMDLHLLMDDGTLGSAMDCYYATCDTASPAWGGSGTTDDPRLLLDDTEGTGPEVTVIPSPAAATYTVAVTDHPSADYPQANAVTVEIWIAGSLAATVTKTIRGEDTQTTFATVELPSGVVTPL